MSNFIDCIRFARLSWSWASTYMYGLRSAAQPAAQPLCGLILPTWTQIIRDSRCSLAWELKKEAVQYVRSFLPPTAHQCSLLSVGEALAAGFQHLRFLEQSSSFSLQLVCVFIRIQMARRIPQSNVGASSLLMCLFLIVTLAVSATQQPARKLGAATTYSRSNRTSLLDNIRSPASTLPASLAWLRGNSNRNSTQMMVTAPQPNEESDGEPAACSARTCLLIEQHSANNPNSMFQVQIVNICIACTICDVRAYCPDFISTIAVDPDVFVRIKETDDCLVNGGNAIVPFNLLIFQYGASFMSVIKPSTSRICKL